jgi:error-prone DNA polymerase
MLQERAHEPFSSLENFKARTHFSKPELRTLAQIGALNCFAAHRRAALWGIEVPRPEPDLLANFRDSSPAPLRPMEIGERMQADYRGLQLSTGPHPMALIRSQLPGVCRAKDLKQVRNAHWVRVAGQVICRQRPGTAKGVCFISMEDETGVANLIIPPALFDQERLKITTEPFLLITGVVQHRHNTTHVTVRRMERLDYLGLEGAIESARSFR